MEQQEYIARCIEIAKLTEALAEDADMDREAVEDDICQWPDEDGNY